MIIIYLLWGLVCVFAPRYLWKGYVRLRDKIGGRGLFNLLVGINAAIFATVVLILILIIAANAGKKKADYLPPHMLNPLTTTDSLPTTE